MGKRTPFNFELTSDGDLPDMGEPPTLPLATVEREVPLLEFRVLVNRRDHAALSEQAKNSREMQFHDGEGRMLGLAVSQPNNGTGVTEESYLGFAPDYIPFPALDVTAQINNEAHVPFVLAAKQHPFSRLYVEHQ